MNLEVQKRVAENMKCLRKSFGYTQEELAERLHMHRTTYTAYESGKKVPSADIILDLAALYHVSADTILKAVDNKPIKNTVTPEKSDSELSLLVSIYKQLSPFGKGCLMERANILLDRDSKDQSPDYNSAAL